MKTLRFETLFVLICFFTVGYGSDKQVSPIQSDVYLQGFYWNSPPGGIWWDSLATLAPHIASAGFGGIWFPSPVKGAGGGYSMGYDPYEHYDFGEYYQKGSRETRFGSRTDAEDFKIGAVYPNPFNAAFTIPFSLNEPTMMEIALYDMNGNRVKTVESGVMAAGTHTIRSNAGDLSTGLYIVKVLAGNRQFSQKLMLIK